MPEEAQRAPGRQQCREHAGAESTPTSVPATRSAASASQTATGATTTTSSSSRLSLTRSRVVSLFFSDSDRNTSGTVAAATLEAYHDHELARQIGGDAEVQPASLPSKISHDEPVAGRIDRNRQSGQRQRQAVARELHELAALKSARSWCGRRRIEDDAGERPRPNAASSPMSTPAEPDAEQAKADARHAAHDRDRREPVRRSLARSNSWPHRPHSP